MIGYSGIKGGLKAPLGEPAGAISAAHGMLQGTHAGDATLGGNDPPGYALLLLGMARLTPGTPAVLACWVELRRNCRAADLGWIIAAQILAALAALWLSYRLAWHLSQNRAIAGLTAGLTFFAAHTASFSGLLAAHIWYTLVLLLYLALLVEAHLRQSLSLAAGSGAALGLSVLFEPLAAVLVPVSAVQFIVLARSQAGPRGTATALKALAFLAAAIMTFSVPLRLAMARGYDGDAILRHMAAGLSERAVFNSLPRSSLFAGIVQPVPLIGDLLSGLLPASELTKFSIGATPGGLAHAGGQVLFPATWVRARRSGLVTIATLLREYVFGQPIAYLVASLPVLMRGLFAGGGVIALAGVFHVRQMLAFARAEGRLGVHLLVLVPVATLLLVNVLLTGNEFWLNPILPFVYAYALAYVAGGW